MRINLTEEEGPLSAAPSRDLLVFPDMVKLRGARAFSDRCVTVWGLFVALCVVCTCFLYALPLRL